MLADMPVERVTCRDCGGYRTYNWRCMGCRLKVLLDTRCHRDRAHMAAQMRESPEREKWFRVGGCDCEPNFCRYKR